MAATGGEDLDQEGLLDNTQAERKLWLLKVPSFVGNAWQNLPPGEDLEIGRMVVSINPLEEDATPEFTLHLSANVVAPIPRTYSMQSTHEETVTYLFSENAQGGVTVDGRVDKRYDMKPMSMGDAQYQDLLRQRMTKFNTKLRQVQVLDEDKGQFMAPLRGDLAGRDWRKDRPPPKSEAWRKRRERKDKSEVEVIIFRMFEKESNWTLKQLVDATNQPMASLKEILNEICVFNKRGPGSGTYELKEEYRQKDQGGQGGNT